VLELYQDLRPAFRHGGQAAIVPPVPEKETPAWLTPVWQEAERELKGARFWIVCGYSLPSYDTAVRNMLRKAHRPGVEHIFLLDPCSSALRDRYASIIRNAHIHALDGLPDGVQQLYSRAREIGLGA